MKPDKINIDRKKISSEEISSRRNFNEILKSYKDAKPFYRSYWFTGVCGLASLALILGILSIYRTKERVVLNVKEEKSQFNNFKQDSASKFVSPPMTEIQIPFEKFSLDSRKGGILSSAGGSKIIVPANSFTDASGKLIEGKVEVKYREFRDPVDFFLSGIPMAYDSAGSRYQLESAGMLEITAFQNGVPVKITESKKIEIRMTSAYEGSQYNLYELDTVERNWVYRGKDRIEKAIPIVTKQGGSRRIISSDSTIIEEIDYDLNGEIIYRRINGELVKNSINALQKEIGEIEKTKPVKPVKAKTERYRFDVDVDPKEFPEMYEYKNILFEVGPENKTFNQSLYSVEWDDVSMSYGKPGVNYNLTFTKNRKSQTFTVYPVYEGKDSLAVMNVYKKKFREYESKLKAKKEEEKRIREENARKMEEWKKEQKRRQEEWDEQQKAWKKKDEEWMKSNSALGTASVIRIFSISNFGIYNSDAPIQYKDRVSVAAIFISGTKTFYGDIFHMDKSRNTLVKIYNYEGQQPNVCYSAASRNVLFAVLDGNTIARFDENDFASIQEGTSKYSFSLKKAEQKFKTPEEVKQFLLAEK